jgi:hypothetical protein
MAAKGPFIFHSAAIREDGLVLFYAFDRDGQHAVLHISGERPSPTPEIITRPYQVSGLKRKNIKCTTKRKAESLKESHEKAKSTKRGRRRRGGGST